MKYYEKLLELRCLNKGDLVQIPGSIAATKWLCREYQKKGYLEHVKRDLYVAISLETHQPNLFEKVGGLEELLRCIALISSLDETALVCTKESNDNKRQGNN